MAPEHLLAILRQTPEQIRLVDDRSDIYSLGMVLAEMLTGHRPFEQSGSYSAFPLQIEAMAVERSKQTPRSEPLGPTSPGGWRASSESAWPPTRPGGTSRPNIWPKTSGGSSTTGRFATPPN